MQPNTAKIRSRTALCIAASVILFLASVNAFAADQYTGKQLEDLETRVGKTYWIRPQDGKLPMFLSAPGPKANTFPAPQKESFEILELYGRAENDAYYKVKFESGKMGYIRPEQFRDQLNLTIMSVDPFADEKRRAEEQEKAEKSRVDWINAQPWSTQVKQAAIKKQPTPGLNTNEVKQVMGPPRRVTKLHGPTKIAEEQWFYPDGSVLIFSNGLLSRVEHRSDEKN